MIKKIILTALLLFAAYNIFLYTVKPATGKGQHQWQSNVIQEQEYVYEYHDKPIVIVGSSLSARLNQAFLPDSFYNLSFSGGSVYTGLNIIKKQGSRPRIVLIEVNILHRPEDEAMTSSLFTPGMYSLRRVLPALREKYQPVNLLSPLLAKVSARKKAAPADNVPDAATFQKVLDRQVEENKKLPDEEKLTKLLADLQDYVRELETRGCKVIFYEMPVHCQLDNSPAKQYIRKRTEALFPTSKYSWLNNADCKNYSYTDGVHMTYASAMQFSKRLIQEVKAQR